MYQNFWVALRNPWDTDKKLITLLEARVMESICLFNRFRPKSVQKLYKRSVKISDKL